ncbi:hypothetical protein TorRG33x02_180000, partial [Trema orientale]
AMRLPESVSMAVFISRHFQSSPVFGACVGREASVASYWDGAGGTRGGGAAQR